MPDCHSVKVRCNKHLFSLAECFKYTSPLMLPHFSIKHKALFWDYSSISASLLSLMDSSASLLTLTWGVEYSL